MHGLRKTAARMLAEVGCSTHEIVSITGHAALAEIERYTANQKLLASAAILKLERTRKEQRLANAFLPRVANRDQRFEMLMQSGAALLTIR
jgi:integrase